MNPETLISALSYGSLLGLSSGLTPGPLSALITQYTLKKEYRSAILICFAPLVADIPIIGIGSYFLHLGKNHQMFFNILAFIGGLYLAYIAIQNFKNSESSKRLTSQRHPFLVALKTILSNPTIYIFWISIGTPLLFTNYQSSFLNLLIFVLSFYIGLIGTKMLYFSLAKQIAERSSPLWINRSIKILSVFLFLFAAERIIYAVKNI